MLAIYKKEVKSYLTSMIGYVFIALLLLLAGIYFTAYNLNYGYPVFGYTLSSSTFVFLIVTPLLTMRVLAEEKKQKTDQLLLTSPVSIMKIVLGKYLAMVTVYLIPMIILCFYPIILSSFGTVSFKMAFAALFGFFLLGCVNLVIGLFISSITESQAIAAVLTFGILFLCYMVSNLESFISTTAITSFLAFLLFLVVLCMVIYQMTKSALLSGGIGGIGGIALLITYLVKSSIFEGAIQKLLSIFDITSHFTSFVDGIFDFTAVTYFVSVIVFGVFLTVQSIQKRRWS